MKMQPSVIVKKLFMEGVMVTVNQEIDFEKAEEIALGFDIIAEKEEKVDVIAELLKEDEEDEDDNLVGRLSFGQIIDKLGAYKSLLISLVVTIVALVIMSMSFTQSMFFVALALLGFSFGALLVIYPPLTGGAFGTSNIGVNYGIMFLGYAASTWISQPITAVLYHAEAGSAAYQQSFYGAIVIAAIAVVLTVYMMVSDSKKKSA